MVKLTRLQEQAAFSAKGLPGLMLAAQETANSVQAGTHGRRRAGSGDSFWQFREYDGQEPASRIDWRQSAKRDRLSVREQEWAALQIAMMWVDDSPSMDFTSSPGTPTKLQAARILSLGLSVLLVKAGEAVGSADLVVRPGCNKRKTEEMGAWLLQERAQDLPPVFELKAHRQQVWFTDALFDLPLLYAALRRHTAAAQPGLIIRITDPGEAQLPYTGRRLFVGTEGEEDWLVQKSEGIAQAYADKWQQHMAQVKALVRAAGWRHLVISTETALSLSLGRIHSVLSGAQA